MAYDTATRSAFIQLRATGKSLRACASELGINRETAGTWAKDLEAEITAERRAELEGIAAQYQLLRAGRLRQIGRILERLDAEIEARDLGEIPTPALMYLRAEWARLAAQEAAALEPKEEEREEDTNPGRRLVDLFGELDRKRLEAGNYPGGKAWEEKTAGSPAEVS